MTASSLDSWLNDVLAEPAQPELSPEMLAAFRDHLASLPEHLETRVLRLFAHGADFVLPDGEIAAAIPDASPDDIAEALDGLIGEGRIEIVEPGVFRLTEDGALVLAHIAE